MKIEIKGIEFSNKGAELMLHSIVQMLDEQLPHYELVLSPGYLLPYQQRAKLGAWQKFSFQCLGVDWTWLGNLAPLGLRRQLRHFGIVVEKDIDVVLDASGFVYSDQWGSQRLKQTLNQLKRLDRYQSKYIFLPQAFGPFQQPENIHLMQQIISHAGLLIARDEQSLGSLKEVDTTAAAEKIKCFPDFTPLLDPIDTILSFELPEKFVCIIPNNKMFAGKSVESKNMYLDFLAKAIVSVESMGLMPVLLNHEGEKDYDFCLDLLKQLENKAVFLSGLSTFETKKVIGLSVFCVSSRYHACISSLSQGVPTIATSWSHKYEALYNYYQHSEYLMSVSDSAILKEKMEQIVSDKTVISSQLLKQAEIHKATNRQMWRLIFNTVCQ